MDIFALGLVTCFVAVTIGYLINKYLRMPWMFTVVLLGMSFTALGLFQGALTSPGFALLSRLGMLFFLLTIGIDLDLGEIRRLGAYIIGGNILLTLTEGLMLALFFYGVFPQFVNHSFFVALVVGVAFGTVGEVILLAILKEFGLENSRFGQLALGIGVFDDIFEIIVLAIAIGLPAFLDQGSSNTAAAGAVTLVGTLVGLGLLVFLLSRAKPWTHQVLRRLPSDSYIGPFLFFILLYIFLYLGSRSFENLGVVAAIFAGIALKQVLPPPLLQQYKRPVFFVANIFLGPFFFLSLGAKMSLDALVVFPLAIVAVVAISLAVRVVISYALFRRLIGAKQSLVLGVGLSAKMSTSVITENLLFSSGLLGAPLYSVIMGAFILMKPLIVGVFSRGVASFSSKPAEAVAVRPAEAAILDKGE